MSSWAIVALVAIVVWGLVDYAKARAGIVTDQDGNEKLVPRDDARSLAELEAARRDVMDRGEQASGQGKYPGLPVTPAKAGTLRPTSLMNDAVQVMGPRLRGGDVISLQVQTTRAFAPSSIPKSEIP
jgi:hypothetical protein